MKLRIGTRGSKLALWQANRTAELLRAEGHDCEIVAVKTTGDQRTDVALAQIGGKGLFIKEIEEALLRNEVDLAVHSLKDVPSLLDDENFVLAAFLERADPRDAWISPSGRELFDLTDGCSVATSSPRRKAQILQQKPYVKVVPIRGNVDTRLRRTRDGEFDATVLASAGLNRLGIADAITALLEREIMIPAAGQGIVGIETLRQSSDVIEALATINDSRAELEASVERGVLQRFGTILDCHSCIAVNAETDAGSITVRSFVSELDGTSAMRVSRSGELSDAQRLVAEIHGELVARGATEILMRGVPS